MKTDLFSAGAIDQLIVAVETLIAGLLGGIVGFERGRSGKGVGMRTHALVAIASAAAVGIGELLITSPATGDHTRTLHAVITGVGFIGAGAILHSERGTQGVTTATSVFLVAVIGASVGVGLPIVGVSMTLLALIVLRVLGAWQHGQTAGMERRDHLE